MRKAILFSLFLIGGCTLGPHYQLPETPISAEWKSETEVREAPDLENWWDLFEDRTLAELEQKVVDHNPTLFAAMERVVHARATAGVSKSDLYPHIDLKPSYHNAGELIELYGIPVSEIPGLKPIVRVHEVFYALPLTMNYELDLWGKFRGRYRSAELEAEAQEEALRGSLLLLTSDLASNYFNLRTLDAEIELVGQMVDLRKQDLELGHARFAAGLVSAMEVANAAQRLANAAAEWEDLKRQRALFENAIAALIGMSASSFSLPPSPLQGNPPAVPVGIPSSILVQRPDIAQMEREMASVHALLGVAYSSFLPAFSLSGALGSLSPDLKNFVTWKSRLWQIGVDIAQSVFDGWKRSSELDAAWARFRETQGRYLKTVLAAFQETEDALSTIDRQKEEDVYRREAAQAAEDNRQLSEKRYEAGLANRLEIIEKKENALQTLRSETHLLGSRYQSAIQLIKALGGRWHDGSSLQASAEEEAGAAQCE